MLPVPGAGGGVGDGHARERAIGKANVDHGGVLGLKTAGGAGLHALDGNGLAQQVAEQVDVVHQVDQNRAGTLLAAPLDVKVLVVLIDHVVEARHGELAQLAGLDDFLGLVDEGVVATVLTHEHGHTGGLGLGGEGLGVLEIVGDRLFDQRHDVALDGLAGNARCRSLGVAMMTASGLTSSIIWAGSVKNGTPAASAVARAPSKASAMATSSASGSSVTKRMWLRPMRRRDDGNADGVELRHFDSLILVTGGMRQEDGPCRVKQN